MRFLIIFPLIMATFIPISAKDTEIKKIAGSVVSTQETNEKSQGVEEKLKKKLSQTPEYIAIDTFCKAKTDESWHHCMEKKFESLPPEKLQELLSLENPNKPQPNNNGDAPAADLESVDNIVIRDHNISNIEKEKTKALKIFEDYVYKKLSSEMRGDQYDSTKGIDQKMKQVDHLNYYQLYDSNITRAVSSVLGNFCAQRDSIIPIQNTNGTIKYFVLFKKGEESKAIENNIKNLKNFNEKQNAEFAEFSQCIMGVKDTCTELSEQTQSGYCKTIQDTLKIEESEICFYSSQKACVALEQIKRLRDGVKESNRIVETLTTKHQEASQFGLAPVVEFYRPGHEDQKSIDELTTVTSNQLINGSFDRAPSSQTTGAGLGGVLEQEAKEFEEKCINPQSEECLSLVNNQSDLDKLDEIKKEYEARTFALGAYYKDDDPQRTKVLVEEHLKKEGRLEELEEVKNMQADAVKKIKDEIQKQFQAERAAIIKEITQRVQKVSISDKDLEDPEKAKRRVEEIANELKARKARTEQLVHYTNIVSGFLEITEGAGESRKKLGDNILVLFRELEDRQYSNDGARDPAANPTLLGDQKYWDELKTHVEEAGITKPANDVNAPSFQLNTLNDNILKKYLDDESQTKSP